MEQGTVLSAGSLRTGGVTPQYVRDRFAVAAPPGVRRGDHDLNPDMLPDRPLTAAAVLVPLVDRPGGITVLLTRRITAMPTPKPRRCARRKRRSAWRAITSPRSGGSIRTSPAPGSR